MDTILIALWPVFLLIILGYLLRQSQWLEEGFWQPAEKFSYFVLFPLLLVDKLSQADITGVAWFEVVVSVLVLLGAGTALLLLGQALKPIAGAAFTSVYQGGMRFNTYVGLACCTALYGDRGLAIAAVMIGLMIPLLNVLCVLVFSLYASPAESKARGMLQNLMKNPLILGCLIGIALNLSGLGFPDVLRVPVQMLTGMALPLALLLVGAGVRLSVLRGGGLAVLYSSIVKLLIFPFIMLLYVILFVDQWLVAAVLMLFSMMPTAPSAYILARQLGGDAELMAVIISTQTLAAILSIPAVLLIFDAVW